VIISGRRPASSGVACGAIVSLIIGVVAARHYFLEGLTLSHYDARGHLIVARRIIDSLTPGWQQIGAVWLPLPHVLNALPVQVDLFYRTGVSGVAISILSFVIASASIAWMVAMTTGSPLAGTAAALVFALNPNVVYLQSTPMTEPLLLALTTSGVALLMADASSRLTGGVLALACLTRYEAWPVTVAALTCTAWGRWRRGESARESVRAVARIGLYPAIAIIGFAIFSRVVVGEWFVSTDFFVPENKARYDVVAAVKEIAWGTRMLSSAALVYLGGIGVAVLAIAAMMAPARANGLIATALLATSATPLVAFYKGHPFRIRYMVPLIAIEAVGVGVLTGMVRRLRVPLAIAAIAFTVATLRPLDHKAPMVVEAQWERPNLPVRAEVTRCMGGPRPGQKIMASMGSLGHYMQEASAQGYAIRDFLHEGNGDIWLAALQTPRPFADWILIEEKAEGGDMLARIARERPDFLDGYARVCEGAGLALYRRN